MSDKKTFLKDTSSVKPFGETTTKIAKAMTPDIIKGLTVTGIAKPVPPPPPPQSNSSSGQSSDKK